MQFPAENGEIKLPAKVQPIGPVHVSLTRQQVRSLGRKEIAEQLRRRFPNMKRSALRIWARELERNAWATRDTEAVAKLKAGTDIVPPPPPWRGPNPTQISR